MYIPDEYMIELVKRSKPCEIIRVSSPNFIMFVDGEKVACQNKSQVFGLYLESIHDWGVVVDDLSERLRTQLADEYIYIFQIEIFKSSMDSAYKVKYCTRPDGEEQLVIR